MIVDTTQTKIERDIASILNGQITYSRQKGFFLTMAQKRAIFWEIMEAGEFQNSGAVWAKKFNIHLAAGESDES